LGISLGLKLLKSVSTSVPWSFVHGFSNVDSVRVWFLPRKSKCTMLPCLASRNGGLNRKSVPPPMMTVWMAGISAVCDGGGGVEDDGAGQLSLVAKAMAAIPPMTAMLDRNFMVDVKWVWLLKQKEI